MARKFGLKFLVALLDSLPETIQAAKLGEKNFETILFTDNLGYRNTWVLLGALARDLRTNLGVSGTWLYSRNPVDTVTAVATITELMHGREFQLGITPGNRIVLGAFARIKPVPFIRESILVMRKLLAGEVVDWAEYPTLSGVTNYSKIGKTRMFFSPRKPVPIMISAVGPGLLKMGGEVADGVFFDSQQPNQGLLAMSKNLFDEISGSKEIELGRKRSDIKEFKKVYGVSISISRDSKKAKDWAKKEAGAVIASKSDSLLSRVGIDPELVAQCRHAQDMAGGFEGVGKFVPNDVVDSMIINGTPAECLERVSEVVKFAEKKGFTEFTFIAPLGPSMMEAVELLGSEVVPSL